MLTKATEEVKRLRGKSVTKVQNSSTNKDENGSKTNNVTNV